ncbi:MAG: thiamine diphosphokinase [Pseudomonadota bacterium]|nr:thiamine diphosphokinase [Pseudomonadota bacterium]
MITGTSLTDFKNLLPAYTSWLMITNDLITLEPKHIGQQGIWAIDGGANCCKTFGIRPDVISGDFDSILDASYWGIHWEKQTPYTGQHQNIIVPTPDQQFTDTDKALSLINQLAPSQITILTHTQHRPDHMIHHLELLKKHHLNSRKIILQTTDSKITYIEDQSIWLDSYPKSYCSVIAAPKATVTSKGLKFEMTNHPLTLGQSSSISNELIGHQALIEVKGSAWIISHLNHHA